MFAALSVFPPSDIYPKLEKDLDMTTHEQVPFRTLNGKNCLVDAGMLDILNLLKRFGVVTQFSGEDNMGTGYVLATGQSTRRFEKKVQRLYSQDKLSIATAQIVENFLKSTRVFEFFHFIGDRSFSYCTRTKNLETEYVVERTYSLLYGYRTTYRWPQQDSDQLLSALKEIAAVLNTK